MVLEDSGEQLGDNLNDNDKAIIVRNISDGETLVHSLALLCGKGPECCTHIRVRNRKKELTDWPIINGNFRALVELFKGSNDLELEAGTYKLKLTLNYEPRSTSLRVTPVYVICSGHDGYFQGPEKENRSPESAVRRIGLGAKLIQTLTAEKLKEAGYGRKTFQLERDMGGPECLIMHSGLEVSRARSMTQRELWEFIGRELMSGPLASKDRKYLAFLSCTRYSGAPNSMTHEDTLARTQGHAALGGGGLAIFGSACLHTWPTCLDEILERFLDTKPVDTEQLMDDSNYRGTHGGCLATTLGSVLHELGHTFDLGHTREGIMGRGFDYVDRVFALAPVSQVDSNRNSIRGYPQHTTVALSRPLNVTVTIQEHSKQQHKTFISQTQSNSSFLKSHQVSKSSAEQWDRTFWGPSCAALLAYNRWFNSDFEKLQNLKSPSVTYDPKRNVVKSPYGIRVIELRETLGAMVVASKQFPRERPIFEAMIPAPPPLSIAALTLVAQDSVGCILKHSLRDYKN